MPKIVQLGGRTAGRKRSWLVGVLYPGYLQDPLSISGLEHAVYGDPLAHVGAVVALHQVTLLLIPLHPKRRLICYAIDGRTIGLSALIADHPRDHDFLC